MLWGGKPTLFFPIGLQIAAQMGLGEVEGGNGGFFWRI